MNELIGIIGAAIFHIALGMFWYSPSVFGKIWLKAKGFVHEDMKNKKMPKGAFMKAIFNALIVASIFTYGASILALTTIEEYLIFALLGALLIMTNEFSKYVWEQEKFVLVVLNTFYTVIAYLGVVSILFYV